jgi:hypothetical protein
VGEEITIQHWMILAFLFFLDVVVLGCLFLIAMNKIYLLPYGHFPPRATASVPLGLLVAHRWRFSSLSSGVLHGELRSQ